MAATFAWKCSYMGSVWYSVTDETGTYQAEIRHTVGAYELSIANGDDVRRDMQSGVGILRREHCIKDASGKYSFVMPAETVRAFNKWRQEEHVARMAKLDSQPERYGVIAADDPLRCPPRAAVRGDHVRGKGWHPVIE